MKQIPLNHGKLAIVDDDDFDHLSRFKWQYSPESGAVRTINVKGHHFNFSMAYFVLPNEKGCFFMHINKDRFDFRKENLKSVRVSVILQRNKKWKGEYSSRFKGVSWSERHKAWAVRLYKDNERKFLGYFKNETAAAEAYNKEAQKHYGDLAYQNQI